MRTGTARGQREYPLPTARAFARIPTTLDHSIESQNPGRQHTRQTYKGSTRYASSISTHSRLIPGLEKIEDTKIYVTGNRVIRLGMHVYKPRMNSHSPAATRFARFSGPLCNTRATPATVSAMPTSIDGVSASPNSTHASSAVQAGTR